MFRLTKFMPVLHVINNNVASTVGLTLNTVTENQTTHDKTEAGMARREGKGTGVHVRHAREWRGKEGL